MFHEVLGYGLDQEGQIPEFFGHINKTSRYKKGGLSYLTERILASEERVCGQGNLGRYIDWLRARRSGDRISVEARFSAPVQTGPGATQPPV
jgi:hypothetical protein